MPHGTLICNVCSRPLAPGRRGGYCVACGQLRRQLARLNPRPDPPLPNLESRLTCYAARAAAGEPLFRPLEVSKDA